MTGVPSVEAFHNACEAGDIAVIRQYIAAGKDVNAKGSRGWIWHALAIVVHNNHSDCLRELVAAGADVDMKWQNGITVLMWAATHGYTECTRELIALGADINARNNEGCTALMWASINGYTDCVRELIAAGADINVKDDYNGRTSLIYALCHKLYETALMLAEAGADIYDKDNEGKSAIDHCKNKRIKAKLIKIANRHITAAIKSSKKPVIIKGFDTEL